MRYTIFGILTMICLLGLMLPAAAGADSEPGVGSDGVVLTAPENHPIDLIEGLQISLVTVPATRCAYMEGTVLGDMNELFGAVMSAAAEQQLFSAETMIGSMYPDDMSTGVDETTRVFCGLSIAADAEVAEPLLVGTIPAGSYLRIVHLGDYAALEETYNKIYAWAAESGVEFTPPTFEVYLTDPETTPVEEWETHIYLPFDHAAIKAAFLMSHGEIDTAEADGE